MSSLHHRAELYQLLAETLSEPPEWMAAAGPEWPLFRCAGHLENVSEAARQARADLARVPAEPWAARRARYRALFDGLGPAQIWLYESVHLSGKLAGPEMAAVDRLYRITGLQAASAELPDHASLELAFLAHLVRRQIAHGQQKTAWQALERQFIMAHAGRWLPEVGRELLRGKDEVYAPIGRLLAGWLREASLPGCRSSSTRGRVPALPRAEKCTLCGFCTQVCMTGALTIHETKRETALVLWPVACSGCGKCARVCEKGALKITASSTEPILPLKRDSLRVSARAVCPACHDPTVSQAELDYVATKIGAPDWLAYCLSCRSGVTVRSGGEVAAR